MSSRLAVFRYLPRTIRPTKEGWYFIALTFGIGFAAINTGNNLLYLLVALMLSIIIVSGLLSEQSLRWLTFSADPPPPALPGEPVSLLVRLRNEKSRFPSFSLRVDPVPGADLPEGRYTSEAAHFISLDPQSTGSQPLRMTFSKRGCYRLEGITLSTTFPFGFFVKTAAKREPVELWVYPKTRPAERPILPASSGAVDISSQRNGQAAAFHQFREYQRGDDCRLIHWKLSARQGRWIIKEREREEGSGVLLVLNNQIPAGRTDGWEARFERAVETAASLASAMIQAGMKVSIQTADQTVAPGEGPAHLDRIFKLLALTEPIPPVPAPMPIAGADGRGVIRIEWEEGKVAAISDEVVVGIDSGEEWVDVV
ncbi:MAG: DUF58 domain-containing protein [Candidatus Manganitrophus sp.]|nr:MAG: DUF58 domain-containing protein [Candidatus Manganitrophus sp.]